MIQHGKYSAEQKLARVLALWAGSRDADTPDAEQDRLRRPLVKKWEGYARAHGRAAAFDYARAQMADLDRNEVNRAVASFCTGGLSQPLTDIRLSAIAVTRLRDAFTNGALAALEYTEDDGEVPTLDMLRARSLSYPTEYLQGKSSALAIFVTYFLGRNDVLHILDHGIPRVTLVDRDADGLELMKLIYPQHWTFRAEDYEAYLDTALKAADEYDVVSCDPSLYMAEQVAWTNFGKFSKIFRKVFISNYTGEMLSKIGFGECDLAEMSVRLSELVGQTVMIGGIYPRIPGQAHHWVVLSR
jgi:hypothetical protein